MRLKFDKEDIERIVKSPIPPSFIEILTKVVRTINETEFNYSISSEEILEACIRLQVLRATGVLNIEEFNKANGIEFRAFLKALHIFYNEVKSNENLKI